jgi:phosphorylase/glycogen(starch) synthase
VRVGRWRIPGRPRCILVGFSGLYEQKNGILPGLWERHKVDSIAGDWDYVEPVLFSIAAGMVIERWWEEFLAPFHRRAVVQAHEWMTGASLLYLQERIPSIGTVFTTHATMLGRALASLGITPDPNAGDKGLGGKTVEELARQHGVQAKHSLEGVCARKADVFTTVSGDHRRRGRVAAPRARSSRCCRTASTSRSSTNSRPAIARQDARGARAVAKAVLGEDVVRRGVRRAGGPLRVPQQGHRTAARRAGADGGHQGQAPGGVPAGAGRQLGRARRTARAARGGRAERPIGLCTHNLFDEERDPVHAHCKRLGLDNRLGSRVKVVQVPIYLRPDDGLFGREYEAVLAAMDLGAYPSYYEPWGYTPQEALAVGMPTITTDLAGFGRWAVGAGFGAAGRHHGAEARAHALQGRDRLDRRRDRGLPRFARQRRRDARPLPRRRRPHGVEGPVCQLRRRLQAGDQPRCSCAARAAWCSSGCRAVRCRRLARARRRGCRRSRLRRRCRRACAASSGWRATSGGSGTPACAACSRNWRRASAA